MKVAILAQGPLALFELGYAVELFALPQKHFSNWYQTEAVTFAEGLQSGVGGIDLQVKFLQQLDDYDMLVVPGWPYQSAVISVALAQAIRSLHKRGGRILTFCTGAFLLAELGLLNHKQVTTHWAYAEDFQQRFPSVRYVDDVLYVYDGCIGCSAGSAAGIDLSIEVIRSDYGYQIANQIARRLVMAPHRSGGQSQFVETPVLKTPNRFSAALDWAVGQLGNKITIDELAEKAVMSRRSFDRKFRAAFGTTPNYWLIQQRLKRAKQLLEISQLSVEQIAEQTGFDNGMTLRHHFRKHVTLSPRQYREQFGQPA